MDGQLAGYIQPKVSNLLVFFKHVDIWGHRVFVKRHDGDVNAGLKVGDGHWMVREKIRRIRKIDPGTSRL